jgi:hypothetical protein
MAILRREVAAAKQQKLEQTRPATVGAPTSEETPLKDPRTDPTARADAERDRQAQMEVLEATFWHEAANPEWSAEATEAVQEALTSDVVVQTALRSIECHSRTCRVEIADDNTGDLAKSLPLALLQLAQTLPYVTANHIQDSDGSRTMILYISRTANEFPRQ